MNMYGSVGKIVEGRTRNDIHNSNRTRDEGFEISEDIEPETDI